MMKLWTVFVFVFDAMLERVESSTDVIYFYDPSLFFKTETRVHAVTRQFE